MTRETCIMHANCQGDELEKLLTASQAFAAQYTIHRFTNYTKEHIPGELLERCNLFLYQDLDEKWEDLASDALLKRLPARASSLCIPNHRFIGYWPTWIRQKVTDFGDSILNRLIDEGAPKAAILRIYLHTDITKIFDIQGAINRQLQEERTKESKCCINYVDFFLERWLSQPMFHTSIHPGNALLVRTANGILSSLGLPELSKKELETGTAPPFPSYKNIEAPIHPQVVKALGIKFIPQDHKYTMLDRQFTFEQFVSRYIDFCRGDYGSNLLAYLQLV